MPCRTVGFANGKFAIVCGGRSRSKPCSVCGKPGDKLCDFPMGGGKTCDKPLCGGCAVHTEPDTDVCPKHSKEKLKL
jgi:hypothetical protein